MFAIHLLLSSNSLLSILFTFDLLYACELVLIRFIFLFHSVLDCNQPLIKVENNYNTCVSVTQLFLFVYR